MGFVVSHKYLIKILVINEGASTICLKTLCPNLSVIAVFVHPAS